MDQFTLLDNIERCCKNSVMGAFNSSIRNVRRQLLSGKFALDSTIVETNPDFPGCGMTKRLKEGQTDDDGLPEYEYIHGFK